MDTCYIYNSVIKEAIQRPYNVQARDWRPAAQIHGRYREVDGKQLQTSGGTHLPLLRDLYRLVRSPNGHFSIFQIRLHQLAKSSLLLSNKRPQRSINKRAFQNSRTHLHVVPYAIAGKLYVQSKDEGYRYLLPPGHGELYPFVHQFLHTHLEIRYHQFEFLLAAVPHNVLPEHTQHTSCLLDCVPEELVRHHQRCE